ncbi:FAD-binding oxidoreductase [Acidianus manzaensis]|uniref:FAD-binding PCMH-type domain-containing protein n=1 Tax=Acidianus manzaensis TaxID=282676 RepID=A0A1W6JYP8_9CREN|nr:FAD-binding oxidoreductase [Acidianus manzaensis]ARM75396.1 hypothetical protein B6F84_04705 [Acidianus manzaensis]
MDLTSVKNLLLKEEIEVTDNQKIVEEKSRDFSHTSPFLVNLLKKYRGSLVVYPKNEEEVIKVVEIALENHVPLVPRAGGKNNVGGIIPLKGGIIIDMTKMNKILNEDDEEIYCEYSLPFFNGRMTFSPRVYPSTYDEGATVGGFFSGGSGGIGEFKYGRNWDYVTEIRMVNPKGKITTLIGGDVKIAAHAEGTTGIVTRLRVQKREEGRKKEYPYLIEFDSLHDALKFVESLYDMTNVYHVTLRSPTMSKLSENITGVSSEKWNVLVVTEDEENIGNRKAGELVWSKRFLFFGGTITTAMGILKKRLYYIVKDIPLDEIEEKLEKVKNLGIIADVEFDVALIAHPFILTESEEQYEEIYKILGGTNFDLNSIKINSRLKPEHIRKIIQYKKMYDKEDLFNPGKVDFQ